MGVQIPPGPSKWKGAFQERQFDVQKAAGATTPWITETDAFIASGNRDKGLNSFGEVNASQGSLGALEISGSANPTAGEGTVLSALAYPPQAGVDASYSPGQLLSQNTDPTPGTINYPYNTSIDAYVEGDLGYDEEPMS